jgi:hypothetical protein
MRERNMSDISDGYRLAEIIRFSGDYLQREGSGDERLAISAHSSLAYDGLLFSAEVTPQLYESLQNVCESLKVPSGIVSAFVRSSPQIQAECISTGTKKCVLRFSSALIELLSVEEFEFVCGHELGHFLLGHGQIRLESMSDSAEYYLQQRAQEISVDRFGLLACTSVEAAIRAMIKVASGLSDQHLRFDTSTFVSQLNHILDDDYNKRQIDTHPSFLIRSRALLWFSMTGVREIGIEGLDQEKLEDNDRRIKSDLDRYVDGPTRALIQEVEENFALWCFAQNVVSQGAFTAQSQGVFEQRFGGEKLGSLKSFLAEMSKDDAERVVYERMRDARDELERVVPVSFNSYHEKILSEIAAYFC